ncbi:MAG: hypothetical protein EBS35_08130 [Bacteroidetes bacterium]|nr:hypothetical protein [Bacteroidota bacterium]
MDEEKIVYIDESGFDTKNIREYGYSKKGARIYAQKSGNRKQHKRISVIAGFVNRSTLLLWWSKGARVRLV